jgi:serine/threonine protein kinase
MALTIGSQLGSHEITGLLGKGGMGEVYRARDLKLKREVAIKILPEEFALDADRLGRFQHEAEVLASLNHPNVAAIYDIQEFAASRFIVLELVEGETLAERIERGPIPLDEAFRIAASIGAALEAAHLKGIVHRDLKPANVKLTADGKVKVLDFGLAKSAEPAPGSAVLSNSPTLMSMAATNAGVILGTAAYMSPEQARGAPVDKRTDIWAFGVVLYEMLKGKSAFAGPTVSDTLALVLTRNLDLNEVPERARFLLSRCLERDVQKRLRDIGDAGILLDSAAVTSAPAAAAPSKRLPIVSGLVALLSIAAAATLAFLHFNERREPARAVQFQINTDGIVRDDSLTVSPDGRYLTFEELDPVNRSSRLRVRALDSPQARTLLDDFANRAVTWSPDSRFVVFLAGGKLKRVAVDSGLAETIVDAGNDAGGAAVALRDRWLFGIRNSDLMQVPASGGVPAVLVSGDQSRQVGLRGLRFIRFLPDEHHFLFSSTDSSIAGTTLGIFAASIETIGSLATHGKPSPLLLTNSPFFSFAPAADGRHGYIFYSRDGALLAQGFDNEKLQVSGAAVTIAPNVKDFAASRDLVVYRSGGAARDESQFRWFDRRGNQVGTLGQRVVAGGDLWLSRDGKTALIDRAEGGTSQVWLGDVARGVFTRLTSTTANETAGALAPDGTVIFTMSGGGAAGDLYAVRPTSTMPELVSKSQFLKHPNDISPDGKYLIYDEHAPLQQDLWILPLTTGNNAKPIPFLTTAADETFGQFSPDGKWVAYRSTEAGPSEVFVRAFQRDQSPAAGARKWLVSTAGGDKPRWSRDGKEIFYIAPDGKLMATPVKIGATFEPGIPVPLFEAKFSGYFPYDVSPDGRFLINMPLAQPQTAPSPINVILNWAENLKKQAAASGN